MKSFFSTGIRHMLLSTFFFSVMNFFIKKAANIPAMEVVFFRSFIALVIGLVMLRQAKESWVGSHRGLLLARGIFGTLALFSFFITLREMPLGSAVTIQYLSPIFTTIIAIFILQEKVKPMQWLFFAISFAGILLIKGFDSRISLLYLGVGIFSAVASGFAYNMVRSLKGKEHPVLVVVHFQLIGAVLGGVYCLFHWQTPQGWEWIYLLIVGVMTHLGQINLTKALQLEKIATVSIYNYLGIFYALFFGYFFFDETYGVAALLGMALVLTGVVINFYYHQRLGRTTAASVQP
jgi:drug/metabolite transporter (DMT)-like permease